MWDAGVRLRSLLLVPAGDPAALAAAAASGADAIVLDLASAHARGSARRNVLAFLREHRSEAGVLLYVRIAPIRSALCDGDLEAVMPGAPDGVMLAAGRGDVERIASRIAVCEALHGLPDGGTRIIAMLSDAAGVLGAGSLERGMERLAGLAWDAQALGDRHPGTTGGVPDLARGLCLLAAANAGVAALDAPYLGTDFEVLRREAKAAARDGFSGKLAFRPDQVGPINDVFAEAG